MKSTLILDYCKKYYQDSGNEFSNIPSILTSDNAYLSLSLSMSLSYMLGITCRTITSDGLITLEFYNLCKEIKSAEIVPGLIDFAEQNNLVEKNKEE